MSRVFGTPLFQSNSFSDHLSEDVFISIYTLSIKSLWNKLSYLYLLIKIFSEEIADYMGYLIEERKLQSKNKMDVKSLITSTQIYPSASCLPAFHTNFFEPPLRQNFRGSIATFNKGRVYSVASQFEHHLIPSILVLPMCMFLLWDWILPYNVQVIWWQKVCSLTAQKKNSSRLWFFFNQK